MSDTILGRILNNELPSERLYEDDRCIVIRDINPQAPIHLLVVPYQDFETLSSYEPEHKELLGHLLWVAGEVAREQGFEDNFRVIINNGAKAGQTIMHLHLHILSGSSFTESFGG